MTGGISRLHGMKDQLAMFAQKVDFFMLDHISTKRMEKFCARALSHKDFAMAARHMARCKTCLRTFRETSRRRRDNKPAVIDLSIENWFKDEHLEYERLISYAGGQHDEIEREITEAHLRACQGCREDVRGFLEYKRRIEPWIREGAAPEPRRNSWKIWDWLSQIPKPAFAAPLAVAATITIIAFLLYRSAGVERRPDGRLAGTSPSPSLSAGHSASPSPQASVAATTPTPAADLVASLDDNGRRILLDSSGKFTGIKGLSSDLQQSIENALREEAIRRPSGLAALSAPNGVPDKLRGTGDKARFKLLSPAGIVLAEDRPVFRWETMNGATDYQVFIGDLKQQDAIASEKLPANATQWVPETGLKRGRTYFWAVTATVDGELVTAPRPTEPEIKFKVLEESKMRELNQLNKSPRSNLALGIFYANAGMVAEAEREFQKLAKQNPDSRIAASLLRVVRSWRK
jgi:hypothetical protein